MLKIQTLSSGSGGNITFVGSGTTNILVDIGLTLPQTLKRLRDANIDPQTIHAILVTHEHTDHIMGVSAFIKKFGTKIYCHKHTQKILKKYIDTDDRHFELFEQNFVIGDISVSFFPVPHDSAFCFGYTFAVENAAVGIATDIGKMTDTIIANLANCQVVVLECNHDKEKLRCNTKYPFWLKRRIAGSRGHLSNTECCDTVLELSKHSVGQVILAHISKENNSPNLAYTTIKNFLSEHGITEGRDIFVDVAAQDNIGNIYSID
jgi:phosphoribosyl 1,2-cyclic phosphodiesterase